MHKKPHTYHLSKCNLTQVLLLAAEREFLFDLIMALEGYHSHNVSLSPTQTYLVC